MGRRRRQRFKSRKKCSSSSESESESKSHDNATNSKSCKVISKLLLPEDMMLGILSWVPLTWLLNSARYVCKPWATIISTYHFAETHLNRARAKPGIYVQSRQSGSSSYFLDIKDDDVINGQFERTDLGTPPRMGHVMSTCDGILLLFDQRRGPLVVNPILKCWLRIPPLLISQAYHSGICHFTIARVPRTAKFKLFFADALKVSSANWYVLYVLRIGIDNSWKEIARKEAPLNWCLGWAPIYSGGNDIYWITTEGVIVMDVDTEITVGEYPPPPPPMAPGIFLRMGNRLSYIVHKDVNTKYQDVNSIYQIYILDIDSGKWTLYNEMGPFDYVAACGHEISIIDVLFRFWINDQIIFRASTYQTGMFSKVFTDIHFGYNVKTRQLTKIEGIVVGDFQVWLHTNTLVSLPSTLT